MLTRLHQSDAAVEEPEEVQVKHARLGKTEGEWELFTFIIASCSRVASKRTFDGE